MKQELDVELQEALCPSVLMAQAVYSSEPGVCVQLTFITFVLHCNSAKTSSGRQGAVGESLITGYLNMHDLYLYRYVQFKQISI